MVSCDREWPVFNDCYYVPYCRDLPGGNKPDENATRSVKRPAEDMSNGE